MLSAGDGATDDADEPAPAELGAWANADVRRAGDAVRAAEVPATGSRGSPHGQMCATSCDERWKGLRRSRYAARPALVSSAAEAEPYNEVELQLAAARQNSPGTCESIERHDPERARLPSFMSAGRVPQRGVQRPSRPGVGQGLQSSGSFTRHKQGSPTQGLERSGSFGVSSSSQQQSIRITEPRMAPR